MSSLEILYSSLEPPIGQGLTLSQETKCTAAAVFYDAFKFYIFGIYWHPTTAFPSFFSSGVGLIFTQNSSEYPKTKLSNWQISEILADQWTFIGKNGEVLPILLREMFTKSSLHWPCSFFAHFSVKITCGLYNTLLRMHCNMFWLFVSDPPTPPRRQRHQSGGGNLQQQQQQLFNAPRRRFREHESFGDEISRDNPKFHSFPRSRNRRPFDEGGGGGGQQGQGDGGARASRGRGAHYNRNGLL